MHSPGSGGGGRGGGPGLHAAPGLLPGHGHDAHPPARPRHGPRPGDALGGGGRSHEAARRHEPRIVADAPEAGCGIGTAEEQFSPPS